jgi:hypothetical protein
VEVELLTDNLCFLAPCFTIITPRIITAAAIIIAAFSFSSSTSQPRKSAITGFI